MKSWNSFSKELTEKKAKRDYDGDGTIETGSKEHAGVVHNAIQRAKGKKADGQDTRKEEVEQVAEADSLAAMAARREKRLAAQRKREGTTGAGHDFGHDHGISDAERKKRQDKEFDAFIGRGKKTKKEEGKKTKKEEFELVDERYKGKHGQSEKEYKDDRSQGGKMVSGDSKMSGAEYTHGRRVKAANPGSQPDEGGKTKPKSQGKMDRGTRADLEYRKANLKKKEQKEELELQELDIKGAVTGALDRGSQFMKKNPVGRAVGNVLKPVGSGRGTARPSVRTQNTIRQNQQSQMNSFEPEGDQIDEGIPMAIGAGAIAAGLAGYKAIKGMQTVNKLKKDADQGTGLMGRIKKRNQMLNQGTELDGKLVEGIRDEDPEKGTEERKKRLEKKRGHKVDDHPEYAKESATPGQPAEKLKTGRKMFTIPDEERSAAAARLKEKARKKRESSCKKEEVETPVVEEAESKAQQRLMGLALSVKRGDTPMSSVTPQVARMAREMKEKDLKDFAGTKHDGLPEKVKKEEPEVSSPLVESLVESAVQRMTAKARRETAADKRLNRQASSAQQRAELNAKK